MAVQLQASPQLSATAGLQASLQSRCETVRVAVAGEIDLATVDQFDWALTVATAIPGRTVEVDLQDLRFCGTEAVHSLVRARRQARSYGIELVVLATSPEVRRVLEMTGKAGELLDPATRSEPVLDPLLDPVLDPVPPAGGGSAG